MRNLIYAVISIFIFTTSVGAQTGTPANDPYSSNPENYPSDWKPREFQCKNLDYIPDFSLGHYSDPNDDEIEELCECIDENIKNGWVRPTGRKLKKGEEFTSTLVARGLIKAFSARLGEKIMLCVKQSKDPPNEAIKGIDAYKKSTGVMPGEFIRLSPREREAYARGVLDGENFIYTQVKHPLLKKVNYCINKDFNLIISRIVYFKESKLERKYLMPWSISTLLGEICSKNKNTTEEEYKRNTRSFDLATLQMDDPAEENGEKIERAFIRGVIDGKVFSLHGLGWSKLPAYLNCLSIPKNMEGILSYFNSATLFAENLNSLALNVSSAEGMVCKNL